MVWTIIILEHRLQPEVLVRSTAATQVCVHKRA